MIYYDELALNTNLENLLVDFGIIDKIEKLKNSQAFNQ